MNAIITETRRQTALGNDYVYVELQCGKHSALVVVCRGASNYVQVIVQNAMNLAWRGMGRRFASVEAAMAAYKTAAVRTMIETANDFATA